MRAVHRGESLIQPRVAAKVLGRLVQLSRRAPQSEVLSERELDVNGRTEAVTQALQRGIVKL